uniref:KH domain-containing protein n=1 Tax=Macrostomum lignano TaxID=282301 RepID=A0A1I8ICE2_9PLAT
DLDEKARLLSELESARAASEAAAAARRPRLLLEFPVPAHLVGKALGSGGKTVAAARSLPGLTFIRYDNEAGVFRVFGTSPESALEARRMLELTEELMRIPTRLVGRVLGKGSLVAQSVVDKAGLHNLILGEERQPVTAAALQNGADSAGQNGDHLTDEDGSEAGKASESAEQQAGCPSTSIRLIGTREAVDSAKYMLDYQLAIARELDQLEREKLQVQASLLTPDSSGKAPSPKRKVEEKPVEQPAASQAAAADALAERGSDSGSAPVSKTSSVNGGGGGRGAGGSPRGGRGRDGRADNPSDSSNGGDSRRSQFDNQQQQQSQGLDGLAKRRPSQIVDAKTACDDLIGCDSPPMSELEHLTSPGSTEESDMHVSDYTVVMFGATGVGKTCLVQRFITGGFRERHLATVEDLYCRLSTSHGQLCTLHVVDTAGGLQYPAMCRLAMEKANAFMLVYSVDNEKGVRQSGLIGSALRCVDDADPSLLVQVVGPRQVVICYERRQRRQDGAGALLGRDAQQAVGELASERVDEAKRARPGAGFAALAQAPNQAHFLKRCRSICNSMLMSSSSGLTAMVALDDSSLLDVDAADDDALPPRRYDAADSAAFLAGFRLTAAAGGQSGMRRRTRTRRSPAELMLAVYQSSSCMVSSRSSVMGATITRPLVLGPPT